MKLRLPHTTLHVSATAVRATRAPLGIHAGFECLRRQPGLELPAKLAITGASGELGLCAELPNVTQNEDRRAVALEVLASAYGELSGLGDRTRRAERSDGALELGNAGDAAEVLGAALSELGWQGHAIEGGGYRIGGAGRHAIAVEVCATGFARVAQLPLTLAYDGPACAAALSWFVLETNARLRLARVDVAFDGAARAFARCCAFVPGVAPSAPGLPLGDAAPERRRNLGARDRDDSRLRAFVSDLELARSAVEVARAETAAALQALSTRPAADHYLALRIPQLRSFRRRGIAVPRVRAARSVERALAALG